MAPVHPCSGVILSFKILIVRHHAFIDAPRDPGRRWRDDVRRPIDRVPETGAVLPGTRNAADRTRRRGGGRQSGRGNLLGARAAQVVSLPVRGARPEDRGREEPERGGRRAGHGPRHVQPGGARRFHAGGGVHGRRRARIPGRGQADRTAAQRRRRRRAALRAAAAALRAAAAAVLRAAAAA